MPCTRGSTASLSSDVVLRRYVTFLERWNKVFALVLLVVLVASGVLAPRFIGRTSQDFSPPSDAKSSLARDVMNSFFPALKKTSDLVVFIKPTDPKREVLSPAVEMFSTKLCELAGENPDRLMLSCGGYFSYEEIQKGAGEQFVSHRGADGDATFLALTLRAACTETASTDFAEWLEDHVMPQAIANATMDGDYKVTLMGCPAFLRVMIKNSSDDLERVDAIVLPIALLTLAYILRSLRLLLISLLCLGSAAAISFAAMYGVTYLTSVFASAPALMMSILIAMSIDYGLFLLSRYSEELTKQLHEHGEVNTPRACVVMLKTAGHTITVSGVTLATCFFGLTFFRLNVLRSFGFGCGIVLVAVLLCNLVIVPLMLLSFPSFFEKCVDREKILKPVPPPADAAQKPSGRVTPLPDLPGFADAHIDVPKASADADGLSGGGGGANNALGGSSADSSPQHSAEGDLGKNKSIKQDGRAVALFGRRARLGTNATDGRETPQLTSTPQLNAAACEDASTGTASTDAVQAELMVDSRWFKLGVFVTSFPMNILVILLVLGCMAPLSRYSFSYTTTDENLYYLPKGASVTKAYEDMGAYFGFGKVFAYQVLMVPKDKDRLILDPECNYQIWRATQWVIRQIVEMPGFDISYGDFIGPSRDSDHPPILATQMKDAISEMRRDNVTCPTFFEDPLKMHVGANRGLVMLACSFMNNVMAPDNSTAMWVRYTPQFAPMSSHGRDWLVQARKLADSLEWEGPLRVYFVGTSADSIDAMDGVDADFPMMVIVTTGVLFLFVLVSFKSLFIPLRSVITIAVTVVFVWGFATLTYENCGLSWTHFGGFDCTHAVVYIVPLTSFSIVVGIGLDYDVFLVTRIVEFRTTGLSTQDAISQGLARTGYIITAAGVIMAVAFCGLFFSAEPFMHQLSFYMVGVALPCLSCVG